MWFRGVPVGAYMRSSGRANGQQRSAHANCEDDVFVQAVVYSFARRSGHDAAHLGLLARARRWQNVLFTSVASPTRMQSRAHTSQLQRINADLIRRVCVRRQSRVVKMCGASIIRLLI